MTKMAHFGKFLALLAISCLTGPIFPKNNKKSDVTQVGRHEKLFRFEALPPNYAETCQRYWKLRDTEQTVKADRLAEDYRKRHIYPTFWLKEDESRIFHFHSEQGWIPNLVLGSPNTYQLTPFFQDQETEKIPVTDTAYLLSFYFVKFEIPGRKLEKFQEDALKYFSSDGDLHRVKDITVKIKQMGIDGSIVDDCFDSINDLPVFTDFNKVRLSNAPTRFELLTYKIRKKEPNAEGSESLSAPAKKNSGKPDTGSLMIDTILWRQPDRYDEVRRMLSENPENIRSIAMSFSFTIYQSGRVVSEAPPTTDVLVAAIMANDLEMTKLLVEKGAGICDNGHVLSGSYACAIRFAAENGTPEIHEYLKNVYREKADQSVFLVVFGSELSGEEKIKACDELTERLGYADGEEGKKQKQKTKAICPGTKEFIYRKLRPGMKIISK